MIVVGGVRALTRGILRRGVELSGDVKEDARNGGGEEWYDYDEKASGEVWIRDCAWGFRGGS